MDRDLELADRLSRQLHRLVRTLERTRAQAAAAHGQLERACIGLLFELAESGPRRLTALAEAVLADPSTVSRQVAELVSLGYVERQPDPVDGRASRLAVTEQGLAHLAERRRHKNTALAAVLADWNVDDREQLVRLMERLNDTFETHRSRLHGSEPARAGQEN